MDRPQGPTFTLPSFNFGNGLVELGALTSLIGSRVAAVLVLGNQGPAGIVWGTISAFGSSSVIRACASGASPGWLRQMFNLRTPVSDSAIGMDLPLAPSSRLAHMVRDSLGQPIGVSCDAEALSRASPSIKEHPSCRDVYAFDRDIQAAIDGLPATSSGEPLQVYMYSSYPFFRYHSPWHHISLLVLSLAKYLEAYLLLRGGGTMAIVSAVPYTFFLFAAIGLEIREIFQSRRPINTDGQLDIVASSLPSVKQLGGSRKVFLGAMKSARKSLWWKAIWSIGLVLYMASLLMSYVLLGQQSTEVVIIWGIFQAAWLVLRVLVSYVKEFSEPTGIRPIVGSKINSLSLPLRHRVANLIAAIAICHTDNHTRSRLAYADDSFSTSQLAMLLAPANLHQTYAYSVEGASDVQLEIAAVIGDVTLSSTAWIMGSKLTPMDLYDSCIVVLNVASLFEGQTRKLVAIPAVRVMSAKPTFQSGVDGSEKAEPLFVPRAMGGGSEVREQEWLYWIPCSSGHWLQFKSTKLSSLGKRTAEVMSDDQLTRLLSAGILHISLKNSGEVQEIVDDSRKTAELLASILN